MRACLGGGCIWATAAAAEEALEAKGGGGRGVRGFRSTTFPFPFFFPPLLFYYPTHAFDVARMRGRPSVRLIVFDGRSVHVWRVKVERCRDVDYSSRGGSTT